MAVGPLVCLLLLPLLCSGALSRVRSCRGALDSRLLFPTPLPSGLDKEWVFYAPRGTVLRLSLQRFSLPIVQPLGHCRSFLSVHADLPPVADTARRLCGNWTGLELLGGRRLTLRLHTDLVDRPQAMHDFLVAFRCVRNSPAGMAPCPDQFGCRAASTPGLRWTQCLPNRLVCDGKAQCASGEDEHDCGEVKAASCPPYQYACRNSRRCVPEAWRCDGQRDCPEGDDEENCSRSCAKADDFSCGDHCIPASWRCDGQSDCDDGSDEAKCPTPRPPVCPRGRVRCPREARCLLPLQLCDGRRDCTDGGDEVRSFCDSARCNGDFTCADAVCVERRFVCDGIADCAGGEDEKNCSLTTVRPPINTTRPNCPDTDFFCPEEAVCIDRKFVCDRIHDCKSGADERNCVTTTLSPPTIPPPSEIDFLSRPDPCDLQDFFCPEEAVCIDKKFQCDGVPDCVRGADEKGCGLVRPPVTSTPPICPDADFFCPEEAVCIDRKYLCDGISDCVNGEDEKGCSSSTVRPLTTTVRPPINSTRRICPAADFFCPEEAVCIDGKYLCDGINDCKGGADEQNCAKTTITPPTVPPPSEIDFLARPEPCDLQDFFCPEEAVCIDRKFRCDGNSDCVGAADEKNCSPITPAPTTASVTPAYPCILQDFFCPEEAVCIDRKFRCDGVRDCASGADERDCSFTTTPIPAVTCQRDVTLVGEASADWLAMVATPSKLCGGVPVTGRWVMTTVDCMADDERPEELSVSFLTRPKPVAVVAVSRFSGTGTSNPVLLQLSESGQRPLCLADTPAPTRTAEECRVLGYDASGIFRQQAVTLISQAECQTADWAIPPSTTALCSTRPDPVLACYRSTGMSFHAILMCNNRADNSRDFFLRGVANCEPLCRHDGCPATFTDVGPLRKWIQTETAPSVTTTPTPRPRCGQQPYPISFRQPRIVGGVEATPGNWPWALAIVKGGRFLCGASLIHHRIALTAAHCVRKCRPNISECQLVIGAHRVLFGQSSRQVTRSINSVRMHPDFTWPTLHNDLAIIRLKRPAPDSVNPVCLPDSNNEIDRFHCYVVGYGMTMNSSRVDEGLQQVRVPLIPRQVCSQPTWHGQKLTEGELCAGYARGQKDACSGDSGGPLQCWSERLNAWRLVGIATWGVSCGQARKPGVYAAVNHFWPWIEAQMRDLLRQ